MYYEVVMEHASRISIAQYNTTAPPLSELTWCQEACQNGPDSPDYQAASQSRGMHICWNKIR